jgi:polysaccharide deacetylase 2 family uncharacterized protein YibQ
LLVGSVATIAVVLLFLSMRGQSGASRFTAIPAVEGVVPAEAIDRPTQVALFGLDSPAVPPPPLPDEHLDPQRPPLEADSRLLEWRDGIALPIVVDGMLPARQAYARAVPTPADEQPRVAIIVDELGLDAERLEQSVLLPGEVGLVHTPYAAYLSLWQRHARWHGHEVMLSLDLQAADYPASDLGPWALDPLAEPADQLAGLERLLARSEAYVGVAAPSEAFGASPGRFAPLAAALAARGLGFVELGDGRLAAVAAEQGLAHLSALGPLDEVPEPAAIDAALARLAEEALRNGTAVGFVQPYPLSFDRLWHWARGLDEKGIALVPVSSLWPEP